MASFSLEGKALKLDSAEDIAPYLDPLSAPSAADTITLVNLQGNTFGVPAAQSLSVHLPTLKVLEHANFADIFTARLLSEIPPALDALLTSLLPLQKLSTVNLSDNAFGLNTQAPLVAFLQKHTPLRHLILNNNGLGPEAGTLVANALTLLAEAQNGGKLETIVCGRNRLENGSMAAWAGAYRAHGTSIRSVKMVQNGIRPEGIVTLLTQGLAHAANLEVLDLQDNTFTATGVAALSATIAKWPQLRELGVGDCLLGRKMLRVFEAIGAGNNKKIETLRLGYNELDAKCVQKLLEIVEGGALPALKRVELNGNTFSEEDESVEKLREILEERREKAGGDKDSEEWGIDELDDLEEPDSDTEEEADDDDDEEEAKEAAVLKDADQEEAQNVAQETDKIIDDLAKQLGKTGI